MRIFQKCGNLPKYGSLETLSMIYYNCILRQVILLINLYLPDNFTHDHCMQKMYTLNTQDSNLTEFLIKALNFKFK